MRSLFAVVGLLTLITLFMIIDGWQAFGKQAQGERLLRMQDSINWKDGIFVNTLPLYNPFFERPERWLDSSEYAKPSRPPNVVATDPGAYANVVPLRITWFGHSIALIELNGVRFLTDPIWSRRVSPYTWIGPWRWYPPAIEIDALPRIDAVLISHDHYDHLDTQTVIMLRDKVEWFVVPLGVGAHLEYWGVPADKIVELDWWEETEVGGVTVTSTPARHASGRTVIDTDRTLWMGFALRNLEHAVYFSGDTGLFPELKQIGDRLGPFDVTLIEVGAYGADWPDWHIGPEQAVLAHNWVRGGVLLPVHWGLFDLARHGWTEPIERTLAAAAEAGCSVIAPQPGLPLTLDKQTLDGSMKQEQFRWWPDLPWRDEAEAIVATGEFDRAFRPDGC